ncbi:3-deoxy-D-manno-octulosonic acid transferase [Filimonas effusa]|uniref:3-deoxy-D-manno-octulosonic acid transferase n=1 Tax=Filimonas effusa TaxID=2508721 RepID=A0A4Q1DEU2_9BACT|nr:glycosyltransferase N-terminal domain-containing protein [Filimonas effusa]RXK87129.1 3-deoxy-D-manno-octulosonic acid transferase [Filimonas effusa]
MGKLFYILFIRLYPLVARVLSLFNKKAGLWVKGRQQVMTRLQETFAREQRPVLWMHCASLGEFEQGRPILEALRGNYPGYAILLTFFSPSGYEVRKNYEGADHIFYLPMDAPARARNFYDIVRPQLVLFVKYEYWYFYLREARERKIPLLLVSGIFRPDQAFFHWYGKFYKHMLSCFNHFFVQYKAAAQLLASIGYEHNVTVAGDTRFDRVQQIAGGFTPIEAIAQFCAGHQVIVAGSTWTEDDKTLDHYVNTRTSLRYIIAPHNIDPSRLKECCTLYKGAVLFSEWQKCGGQLESHCLIIDNIGMLSRLYAYATICFVGGGFGGDGIHNILEAAVYEKPVVFGPVYDKYQEGTDMVALQGAYSVSDALQLEQLLDALLSDEVMYQAACRNAGNYVKDNTGATERIVSYIQEKRLLTS